MRRYRRYNFDEFQTENINPDLKYDLAFRKMKRIKGFYIHLMVYVLVNISIIFININNLHSGESYFKPENFFTAFFWGIGLVGHGLSVFGRYYFFGKNWEEKKIQQFMEKDKSEKWE